MVQWCNGVSWGGALPNFRPNLGPSWDRNWKGIHPNLNLHAIEPFYNLTIWCEDELINEPSQVNKRMASGKLLKFNISVKQHT